MPRLDAGGAGTDARHGWTDARANGAAALLTLVL